MIKPKIINPEKKQAIQETIEKDKKENFDVQEYLFKDCEENNLKVENTDIRHCKFKNISFNNCNLSQAQLFRTSLNKVDFTTCNLEGMIVATEDIKGMIVNELQALELSKLLGIKIK